MLSAFREKHLSGAMLLNFDQDYRCNRDEHAFVAYDYSCAYIRVNTLVPFRWGTHGSASWR